MDNASAYGAEDSRFDPWQTRNFFHLEINCLQLQLDNSQVGVNLSLLNNFFIEAPRCLRTGKTVYVIVR